MGCVAQAIPLVYHPFSFKERRRERAVPLSLITWKRTSSSSSSCRGRSRRVPVCLASSSGAWVEQPSLKEEPKKKGAGRYIAGVQQTSLVDPWLLADPDSRFADYYGVQIHYKIALPKVQSSSPFPNNGDPCSNPIKNDPSSNPIKEELSLNPSKEELSINPNKEDPCSNPIKEDLPPNPIVPFKEELSLNPNNALNPSKEELSLNPIKKDLSLNPNKEELSTNPDKEEFPTNSDKEELSLNPSSEELSLHPDTSELSMNPSVEAQSLNPNPVADNSQPNRVGSSFPAILLHGFGASLFSWERIIQALAGLTGSKVVAFDRPAFGLTSRVRIPSAQGSCKALPPPSNPYSVGFSSSATLAFVDFLQAEKAILIGHSAGCIVAADAYLKDPSRIAAIVMVAPAIIAPMLTQKITNIEGKQKDTPKSERNESSDPSYVSNLLTLMLKTIVESWNRLRTVVQRFQEFLSLLWCQVLSFALRSWFGKFLIQTIMDKFSLQAVRIAWFNQEKIDDSVIKGYTKPLQCRDWEHALVEYVIAMIANMESTKKKTPLGKRLREITCPVLVVTGDCDRIVPAWNAERLAKALPKATFKIMKNCGHLPQEEMPSEFLQIVQEFMKQVQQTVYLEEAQSGATFVPA